jgi:hypothetical protein
MALAAQEKDLLLTVLTDALKESRAVAQVLSAQVAHLTALRSALTKALKESMAATRQRIAKKEPNSA